MTRFLLAAAAALMTGGGAYAQSTDAEREFMYAVNNARMVDARIPDVIAMIESGINVNFQDSGGSTPLHIAAFWGREQIVEALLKAGADPNAKTNDGQTAAELARIGGYPKIKAMIDAAASPSAGQAPAPVSTSPQAAVATSASAGSSTKAGKAGSSAWPGPRRFQPGEQVLYRWAGGKWAPGQIRKVDEHGYQIEGDFTGTYDHYRVVGREREPFWTGFFVGDWRISVPVSMNQVTDGRNLYRSFAGGMSLPPLRINADGSYSWRVQQRGGERVIQGRWDPNPDGPGVILRNGEDGADWLVYNNTYAGSILGEMVILSAPGHTHYNGSRIK